MDKKLRNKILKKYKYINCTIDCGDGWLNLINDLCKNIQKELNKKGNEKLKQKFVVDQIKEKFGGLRFYVHNSNENIYKLIDKYIVLSFRTCECCGCKGEPYTLDGWLTTLCKKCAKKGEDAKL